MVWSGRWVKWALLGAGLLTTSCAGVVGAGAAVVVVGAGVLSMTCYDRVSVTVTDQLTGTKLCDAKVTFREGTSESVTEATSCYDAALSDGTYTMRVERRGLVPYEVPVVINTGRSCKHAVQTLYVALDRPNMPAQPQFITPPHTAPAAPAPALPASAAPAAPAAPAAAPAAPVPAPAPSVNAPPAAAPSAAPPPAAGTFPTAP